MTTRLNAFAYGAFGGTLPTIANMASTYVAAPATNLPEIGLYLGVLLWAIVGGGVALTNTGYEARQAIFAGVAAPAILVNIVAGATGKQVEGASLELFSPAYAQTPDGANILLDALSAPKVVVLPTVKGGIPNSVSLAVSAEVTKDGQTEIVDIGAIKDLGSETTLVVPPGTSQVLIDGKPVSTTGELTTIDLSVTTAPSAGGDLLWALGAPRRFSIQQLDVSQGMPGDAIR
ncbi:hypothetical protein [Aminobacter sp. BE322]|uniref:hypothetical protein n=1 Tax=unclassified Aminobacter TaxID=2644704 RepID=UPI003D1D1BC4